MSRPSFSRKRKGKKVDPYPLGDTGKSKSSRTKGNAGRPRKAVSDPPATLEELNRQIEELEENISHWEGILNEDPGEVDDEAYEDADYESTAAIPKLRALYRSKTEVLVDLAHEAHGGHIFEAYYDSGLKSGTKAHVESLALEMMSNERDWLKEDPGDKEAQALVAELDKLPEGNHFYAWRSYFRANPSHTEYAGSVVGSLVGLGDYEEAAYILEITRGDRFSWDT